MNIESNESFNNKPQALYSNWNIQPIIQQHFKHLRSLQGNNVPTSAHNNWLDLVQPMIDIVKSLTKKVSLSANDYQHIGDLIREIRTVSQSFTHRDTTHNFTSHAETLLATI